MKSWSKYLQFGVSLAGSVALLIWAVAQGRRASHIYEWTSVARAEVEEGKPNPIFELKSDPPTAALALRRSSSFAEDLFPPDRRNALADTQTALQMDPMLSTAWLAAARDQVYMGQDDKARVSLGRSDELNPRFPGQRLAAVRLWHILGNQEKSIQTALNIAALHGEFRNRAATALVRCGHPPAHVFELLDGASLRGTELSGLLDAIRSPDAAEMMNLFTMLNDNQLDDKEVLVSVGTMFCDPVVPDALESLWKRYDPGLETAHAGILLQSTQLDSPPFVNLFPLGWQKPSLRQPFRSSWTGKNQGSTASTEVITVEYSDRDKTNSWWIFYTVLVRAGVEATATTRLRVEPAERSRVTVILCEKGKPVLSTPVPQGSASWQSVSVKIPPAERDRILEFVLQRMPLAGGFGSGPAWLYIDSFQVEDGDQATSPSVSMAEDVK